MPMAPLPTWIETYQSTFDDAFASASSGGPDKSKEAWAIWVNDNAKQVEVAPPYKSQGLTNEGDFAPLEFPATGGNPVTSALILATAWQNWYLKIQFPPSPPSPPFLTIIKIDPSPVGVPLAFAALLAGLIAEMAIVPPDPNTAFLLKGTAYGTLFNTATLTAGVQITGTAPGAPPVPLVLPLIPVL